MKNVHRHRQQPPKHHRKGFSLIEALAATAILSLGIAVTVTGFAALTKGEARAREREVLQRLVVEKYEELLATGDVTSDDSGDFSDRNISGYAWTSTSEYSGTTSVYYLTVKVTYSGNNHNDTDSFTGVVYNTSSTSSSTTSGSS